MTSHPTNRDLLRRLGAGESIDQICQSQGLTREDFDRWWQSQTSERLPQLGGALQAPVDKPVEVLRDASGIPHVMAENDDDLFFGFGLAMAQDRLWQLDYLRRRASGRLAEVLGPEAVEQDRLVRTVGVPRIAERELEILPGETRRLLEAFCRGINAVIDASRDRWSIEFDLLGYQPEPWSPLDSVAIWGEFRWYLTGRMHVIAVPEIARRVLGDGPLYQAFLTGEADEESIVPPGHYPARPSGQQPIGTSGGDAQETLGSNNWVVAGQRSVSGAPRVASDPHIAFGAVSIWYEVHLSGGSFDVAGMAYPGVPAVLFGRNRRVAWGITNNICSQRDLYQEKTDPAHPGCFLYDGKWEPARERTEQIAVKGRETLREMVRSSRNGPIVDRALPEAARHTGPVSLRWLGAEESDELTALLAMDRATSCDELRAAVKDWSVPTWNFVFADADGNIGYQCVGRIPVRANWNRGYRPGWDPEHQWQGVIPYEAMPALVNPDRGFACSANNRVAPDDYPYSLSGTWSSGHRARRIRELIESRGQLSREDFAAMHCDTLSLRASEAVPPLVPVLDESSDVRVQQASVILKKWNCRMDTGEVGATLFEVFFRCWCIAVAEARFEGDAVAPIAEACPGLALSLLSDDPAGWLGERAREDHIRVVFQGALDELTERLGPEIESWTWGRLHTITLRHVLSARGDLGLLLSRGGIPVGGHSYTVCNTASGPDYEVTTGATYRMIAELNDLAGTLWAIDAAGQSGHPASEHYCDQLEAWSRGEYHAIPLDREQVRASARYTLRMTRR